MGKARVVVLSCDGFYQRELIRLMQDEQDLVGVVLQMTPNAKGTIMQRVARYRSLLAVWRYLIARTTLARDTARARPLLEQLFHQGGATPELPVAVPLLQIGHINHPRTVSFVRELQPDLVCVNGTQLLREPMLALQPRIRLGIINLHTGLSPYTRGGNCNLFALLDQKPEWVGVTVHHIDAGIDSGDLILTAQVPLAAEETYASIDIKTFRLGIDLMLVAVRQLLEGRAARVKQWEPGKAYLRKTGYVYEPYQQVLANRLIRQGLIRQYLEEKSTRDAAVRLVGEAH